MGGERLKERCFGPARGQGHERGTAKSSAVKKLALWIVLLLAVFPAAASNATGARADHFAAAVWMFPTKTPHVSISYAAFALTGDSVNGKASEFAGMSRSRCERHRIKHGVMIECRGGKFVSGNPDEVFQMSPDGTTAKLEIKKHGVTHSVSWSSDVTDVGLYSAEEVCIPSGDHGYGGGLYRNATAAGTVFGKKLGRARGAWLETGVMVSNCMSPIFDFDSRGRLTGYSMMLPR